MKKRLIATSAAARPAAAVCLQIGRDQESFSSRRIDIINLDGLYLLQEVLTNNIGNSFLSQHVIVVRWFIQNQAQRGP